MQTYEALMKELTKYLTQDEAHYMATWLLEWANKRNENR